MFVVVVLFAMSCLRDFEAWDSASDLGMGCTVQGLQEAPPTVAHDIEKE